MSAGGTYNMPLVTPATHTHFLYWMTTGSSRYHLAHPVRKDALPLRLDARYEILKGITPALEHVIENTPRTFTVRVLAKGCKSEAQQVPNR